MAKRSEVGKLLLEIIEFYKDNTISEIIQDIHSNINQPKRNKKIGIGESLSDISEERLKKMTIDEIVLFLKNYSKTDLLRFCNSINLKVSSKESIGNIIDLISNHYSFINLNQLMAGRNNTIIDKEADNK